MHAKFFGESQESIKDNLKIPQNQQKKIIYVVLSVELILV